MTLLEMGLRARAAANELACMGAEAKNAALSAISQALQERGGEILAANREDIALAENAGLSKAMIERLTLTQERLAGIARAILKVRDLPDPVGEVLEARTLYNGLRLEKRRVPMGVICVIYESRPNVTVDSAVLCLKAGSAAILRGGKETIRSNLALEAVMRAALESVHANPDCVQLVHDTARETARELMGMRGAIDLLIPRGGAGLIRSVVENAKVPVIETGAGNCHVYVDAKANLEMAAGIIQNAKMQRPSVCNAAETLLVHKDVAAEFLPMAQRALAGCELRGCARGGYPAGHRFGHGRRLRHGIQRLHSGRARGGFAGRGHCAHRALHHAPFRSHHNRGCPGGGNLYAPHRRRSGVPQRFHALYRWRGIWLGRGNWHFHAKNARTRADGPAGNLLL